MASETISLYLDLEPGQVADLEVVARAAIAWSQAIKEMAYILEPGLEIRVELASGTPGSLSLDSLIRAVSGLKDDPEKLKRIALGILLYFALESRDWVYSKALDILTDGEPAAAVAPFTQAQVDQIAEAIEKGAAKSQVAQVYRELERDPSVRGVGVTPVPGLKPETIVPRSEFAARAGHGQIREETITRRIVPASLRVALIKPVLVPGERRWSLRSAQGEFGYSMKDKEFLERVLSGTTAVPLMAGIEMDVEIETAEEFKDGVWVVADRSVVRVLGLHHPPRQVALPFPAEDNEPEDDTD